MLSSSSIPSSRTFSLYTHLIHKSLENHLYSNALFYASQLYSQYPNPQSLHLYATCMFYSRDYGQAMGLLEGCKVVWYEAFLNYAPNGANHARATKKNVSGTSSNTANPASSSATSQSSTASTPHHQQLNANFEPSPLDIEYLARIFLLYAVTCIELHQFQRAEDILTILWDTIQDGRVDAAANTSDASNFISQAPSRSVVAYYLGICCLHIAHRSERAISYFIEAAHAGMWCAVERLCQLGYNERNMHDLLRKRHNEWLMEWEVQWEAQQEHYARTSEHSEDDEDDDDDLHQQQHDDDEMRDDALKARDDSAKHGTTSSAVTSTPAPSRSSLTAQQQHATPSLKTPSSALSRHQGSTADAHYTSSLHPPRLDKPNKKRSLSSRVSIASTVSHHLDKHLSFTTPSPHVPNKEGSYGIISPPPSAPHVSFKTPSSSRRSSVRRASSDTASVHSSEWVTPSPNRINHHTGPPPIHFAGNAAHHHMHHHKHKTLHSDVSSRRSSIHSPSTQHHNQSNIANRLFVSSTITPRAPQSIFMTPKSTSSRDDASLAAESPSVAYLLAPDDSSTLGATQQFIRFFSVLGRAYQLFSLYKCDQSLLKFQELTPQQRITPWVMGKIARCYFEMEDYERAYQEFMTLTQMHSYRLEDLEYFSTTLWHLKRAKELSFLAMRMSNVNKFAPQTLITIGNCFSLQKDHEKALQFFERASQLDPYLAYAHTLAGHEHVENDDTEDAMHCYREALRIDNRHYNAWYGLGTVYHRQEKHDKAKQHFEIALRIKPQSSVMRCYLGMTLKDSKMLNEALKEFDRALRIMPNNPMTKFKRAEVLIELGDFHTARDELEDLKRLVPREAYLYCTLGDVYAQLGDEESKKLAADHYQSALQLGFKDHGGLKEKIANLFDASELSDSMDQ